VASSSSSQLIESLIKRCLGADDEFAHFGDAGVTSKGMADFRFAADADPHDPVKVFPTVRWGGQFVYCSRDGAAVANVAKRFSRYGFDLETPPTSFKEPFRFFPLLGRNIHYFRARKMQLIPPGDITDRFTYMVELTAEKEKGKNGYVVTKRVPTDEWVINRLKRRWPELPYELVEKRARKFTEKIFPLFLTREAAILKILQEHLPAAYRSRVPIPVYVEKDSRGFVRVLQMNWLRNGGKPLSQYNFALQAADLLRAVHDAAEVIHLDLRLDNMVITENGVGFVDFGSAVRVGEDISSNPLLATLYGELMKTSHIQRMLDQMTISGHVTAEHFCNSRGRVDKSVDVFYLAVQFNSPHDNPDLKELIDFKPGSDEAQRLSRLTKEILTPENPTSPTIRTARDVLLALRNVGDKLK
jgi:hypothetical protein